MRTVSVIVVMALVVLTASSACGPSAQVRAARTAVYSMNRVDVYPQVFEAVKAEGYTIVESDEVLARLRTAEVWYDPDGSSPRRDAEDSVQLRGGSLLLALVVQVAGTDGSLTISIEPRAAQFVSGSPMPRRLTAEDPAMPGWVESRVDRLHVAIFERLSGPAPATP